MQPTKRPRLRPAVLAGGALSCLVLTAAYAQTPVPRPVSPTAPRAVTPAAPRSAATTPAPATAGDYDIRGFRSANFGMTQAQTRAAVAADFGAAVAAKITESVNPAEGTTILQVTVPRLEPGPGAAQLTYIFGASSKTLAHINVVWMLDGEPDANQRQSIMTAAGVLANYFQTLPNPPRSTLANNGAAVVGPNTLLVYGASDRKGAGIQVVADGISYQATSADNKPANSPPPKGPATLQVSYISNTANPDVIRIKPGAF